jgi:hypothetical protein
MPISKASSRLQQVAIFWIVQYPGPSTHENPIYAGRFNMAQRRSVSEERVDL